MPKQVTGIIIAALVSCGVFLFVYYSKISPLFMFLSTLPLFAIGFSGDIVSMFRAGAVATLTIAMATANFYLAALFFLLFFLPSWHICRMALRHTDLKIKDNLPTLRIWYPVGLITINLAVYACVVLGIITAVFAMGDVSLPQHIEKTVGEALKEAGKNYEIPPELSIKSIAFILCGSFVWFWSAILLGHAWVSNHSLRKKNLAKRPSLAITPFPMPNWLLSLLSIWALASIIGSESMRFMGKASLIILLMPYFFQGAAMLHIYSKNWGNRLFSLSLIYISVIFFAWPALLIAGIGLWNHIKILNKHLSSGGTSSKS